MTAFAPSSAAFETAIVIPRSLNEPVGFKPSYLMNTSHPRPTIALKRGEWISGVEPSFNEMTGVFSVTGRYCRQRAITPRSCNVVRLMDERARTIDRLANRGKRQKRSGACAAA